DGVAALGEMMNMPGVIESDAATHEMIAAVLDAGLPVTGHWSLHGWDDNRLHAYAAAGVDSDHETVFCDDALAKLRAGMWVQFREGSAWHDVAECVRALTEHGLDSRHALIVTDDMHPGTLAGTGHLNHAVRTAIAAGLDPLLAVQLATVNAAEYLGRRHDIGSLRAGPLRRRAARRGPARDAPARRARRRPAGAGRRAARAGAAAAVPRDGEAS